MKALKFAPDLVRLIRDGKKTSTWRLFDDKDLCEGDEVELVNAGTGEIFAEAKLGVIREKPLSAITDADYEEGHERYDSVDELLASFRGYYGDRVTLDALVKIVPFQVTKWRT